MLASFDIEHKRQTPIPKYDNEIEGFFFLFSFYFIPQVSSVA